MQEIRPGVHHWTSFRDTIGMRVSSYWIEQAGVLIDPLVPEDGFGAFDAAEIGPQQVVLTSGLHTRHAARLAERYGIPVRAPREARERLGDALAFDAYGDGDEIAPGVQAVHVGVLCPDEYALHVTAAEPGAIALADAVHTYADALDFFDDGLLGEDPEAVKEGLREQLRALLARDFDDLLPAHGDPVVGGGKRALRDFAAR